MSTTDVGRKPTDISEAVHQVDNAADMMGGGSIATLWGMISGHTLNMYIAIISGFLSAVTKIAPAGFAALVVWQLQEGNQQNALYFAIGMALSAVASVLLFSLSTTVSHLIAAAVQSELRLKIAEKLKRVPLGYFTRISGSDIKKILIDDVEQIEDGIAHLIPEISAAIAAPVFILLVMFGVEWRLAIFALLPTIISLVLTSLAMRGKEHITNRFYQTQADIAGKMGEVVQAIPVVKTFNHADSALQLAKRSFANYQAVIEEWVEESMVKSNWFFVLSTSNLLFVTPLSLWFLQSGWIGFPVFLFFNIAALGLSSIVSSLFGIMNRIRTQEGILARYKALMSEKEITQIAESDVQFANGTSIEFKNVGFKYDETELFNELSFSVPEGSSVALVGPSGAGKSTIARLLARFWDIQTGTITVGGADIRKIPAKDYTKLQSFVFQDVFLFTRSVKDNILIGRPDATEEEVIAAAKSAKAHEFIEALPDGYDTVLGNERSLSVGQKQRVSIARALLRDAPILILDEATSFADPENEHEVQEAVSKLCQGKTLIVVAHRLSTIQHLDQIIFIDGGKIVEKGTHDELLKKNGLYAKQWNSHIAAKTYQVKN